MKGFPRFVDKLREDVQQLHDSLWHEWEGDKDGLHAGLLEGTEELDAFLGLDGQLLEHVRALAEEWHRGRRGGDLFEFLYTTLEFALATELYGRGDLEEAARHGALAAENLSIGLCSATDCFYLLPKRESGEISFETYADELAKVLEGRGVGGTRAYAVALTTVWTLGTDWDEKASDEMKRLVCRSVLATSAYCIGAAVSIGSALGASSPGDPFERLPNLVFQISQR